MKTTMPGWMVTYTGRRLEGDEIIERKRRRALRRRARRVLEAVVAWFAFLIYLWIVIGQAAKGIPHP